MCFTYHRLVSFMIAKSRNRVNEKIITISLIGSSSLPVRRSANNLRHGSGATQPSPYLLNIAAGNGHFNRSAENFDIQTKRRFATAANNIALRTVKRA